MTGPLNTLLLSLIALGLLLLMVLVIYLVDKVSDLEKQSQARQTQAAPAESGPFAGLSSKKLWDALSGRPPEGLDPGTLAEIRERYGVVLSKHIEALFEEGLGDGKSGLSGTPKNTRIISTLRGPLESWLPSTQANVIYKCGLDFSQALPEDLEPIRLSLDEACSTLYQKVQLPLLQAFSGKFLPQAEAPAAATPGAPAAAVVALPATAAAGGAGGAAPEPSPAKNA